VDDLALLGKWSIKLHAHLEPNVAIPVDRDVATGPRLLCPHRVPDDTAALRYHAREFGGAGLASDDGERTPLSCWNWTA